MPTMRRATTAHDIDAIAALAREIWTEHFAPIIGKAQVDHMLDRMQSAPAIEHQMREQGYQYYLAVDEGEHAGYFALVCDPKDDSMQLSKLYLKRSRRGRGLGRAMLAFVEDECASRGIRELWLTVNKNNSASIAFYRRAGFAVVEPMATDIGHGFVMDDYKMGKRLG
jgi:ribosomal protein S18 acetylase RimI-like enzyme